MHHSREHQIGHENLNPGTTDTKIEYHRHWLLGNFLGSHIAVGASCSTVHDGGEIFTNEPGYVACDRAGDFFKCVFLVLRAIIPLAVKKCGA